MPRPLMRGLAPVFGCLCLVACQTDQQSSAVSLKDAVRVTSRFEQQAETTASRKTEDILAILQAASDKTTAAIANLKQIADDATVTGWTADQRALSLYRRGVAAGELGRVRQMLDDEEAALAEKPKDRLLHHHILTALASAHASNGDLRAALQRRQQAVDLLQTMEKVAGRVASGHAFLARFKSLSGDIDGARADLAAANIAQEKMRRFRGAGGNGVSQSLVLRAESAVALDTGHYEEAEKAAMATVKLLDELLADGSQVPADLPVYSPETTLKMFKVNALDGLARALVRQDRVADAEIAARQAVVLAVSVFGRNSTFTANSLGPLIAVLLRKGRIGDARTLAGIAVDMLEQVGVDPQGHALIGARNRLAAVLVAAGDHAAALQTYQTIARDAAGDHVLLDRFHRFELDRVVALLQTDHAGEVAAVARDAAEHLERKLGEKNFETAQARGLLAVAQHRQGNRDAALAGFRAVFPILSQRSRQSEEAGAVRNPRLRLIFEGYLEALGEEPDLEAAAEAFRVADTAGSHGVQAALIQSAARASVRDPKLQDLVRREQDAQKQISALYTLLAQAVAQGDLDSAKADRLRRMIDELRDARAVLTQGIESGFPDYADLINPRPATLSEVTGKLSGNEAMLVTFVGQRRTFVWAIPGQGKPAFAAVDRGWADIRHDVEVLQRALKPDVVTLGDIPDLNLQVAYDLYARLLKPVAAGWQQASDLFVVGHGPLGYLPFALLPTAPAELGQRREPLFSRYAGVPWLIRKHSVAMLPSVSSLAALRNLPAAAGTRRAFAGFGDPAFSPSREEAPAPQQVAALTSRGAVRLRSAPGSGEEAAGLETLPRLPETNTEIRQIAETLKADPQRDIFIGRKATEEAVKSANLSAYRVLAFATHGLIPGDLAGLSQPALALSSPAIVGGAEDGLLTMSEVLGLKLDADWVVLSACNTGAADDDNDGAEAVSGLGRAFFYAGTRAVLVSNWPVESSSAMALTTGLFARQAKDPALSRAQALRQAMLSLIDGGGLVDTASGRTVFSYAHPIFWAPFSLVGDGGSSRPAG